MAKWLKNPNSFATPSQEAQRNTRAAQQWQGN